MRNKDTNLYSIVIPVYNESEVIKQSYNRISTVMKQIPGNYELIFVNDGSRDDTFNQLLQISDKDKHVKLIDFSRNFGHQIAISAGMKNSKGDAVIVIDADLQDPPEVISEMIEKWREGFDVVYGKRLKREGETFFKKFTAKMFYRFMDKLTDVDIPVDVGDFRLIDRKVCDTYNSLNESDRYVRGLISWIGFKQTEVNFVREERVAGETKYTLKKMINLAKNGLISFSNKPLQLPIYLSIFTFLIFITSIALLFIIDINKLLVFVMMSILLLQGIILFIMGIFGNYMGSVFENVKRRPLYVISKKVGFDDDNK